MKLMTDLPVGYSSPRKMNGTIIPASVGWHEESKEMKQKRVSSNLAVGQ